DPLHDHAGPEVQERDGEGVDGRVEAGRRLDHAVVVTQAPAHDGVNGVVEALAVGLHGALGQAGRAAGQQDHLRVLWTYRAAWPFASALGQEVERRLGEPALVLLE